MKNLVKCKACDHEIAKKAKVCPNCGNKKKNPIKSVVIGATVAVIAFSFIGLMGDEKTPTQPSQADQNNGAMVNEQNTKKSKFEFKEEPKIENSGGFTYIVGVITNTSGKKQTFVNIQFDLYDKDGVKVGSAIDLTDNLEDGESFRFKAMASEENFQTFKFKE